MAGGSAACLAGGGDAGRGGASEGFVVGLAGGRVADSAVSVCLAQPGGVTTYLVVISQSMALSAH